MTKYKSPRKRKGARSEGPRSALPGRKEKDFTLEESEEMYRALLSISPDGVTITDLEGRVTYTSPRALEMHGLESADEVLGMSAFEMIAPEDRERALANLEKTLREGYARDMEYSLLRKDGTRFTAELNAALIRDANGAPKAFVAFVRDISERRRLERELLGAEQRRVEGALRESEEKYRLFYDYAGEMIFSYDAELRISSVNRQASETIGYSEEELVGRNILELGILHPGDFEKAAQGITRLFSGERSVTEELRLIKKDGSVIDVEMTGAALYDDGKLMAVIDIVHDITQRKMMEERLEGLNRCFLGLGPNPLENMQRLILAARDLLGLRLVQYGRMDKGRLSVFSSAREREGFTVPSRAERHPSSSVISRKGDEPLEIEFLGGMPFMEGLHPETSGMGFFLGFPVRLRGRTTGALCLFSRERKDLSPADHNFSGMLAQALAIEEERSAHEEFIKDIIDVASHELRTPLSIIKGYVEAFRFGDLGELSDLQADRLGIIDERTDRITTIVDEMLNLSRIEKGPLALRRKEIALGTLVREAVDEMRGRGCENSFSISVDEGAAACKVDPVILTDVMLIIMDNAARYSPPAFEIDIAAALEGEELVVSVLDRGPGIPEEDRERVFERFFQGEEVFHHSSTGIGLGLYIAKRILEANRGRIWCEPREGGGSIFRFSIPC